MFSGSIIQTGLVLTPGALATVYTVPAGLQAVFSTIAVVNNDGVQRAVRIAISAGATPGAAEWVTPQEMPVPPDDTLMMTAGFTAGAGQQVVAWCETGADVVVRVFGRLEEAPTA